MCVSPWGMDVTQEDKVQKGQPEMHQTSCDPKELFFFKIIFDLGSFHSSLATDLQLNGASFVCNHKYMHNFDIVSRSIRTS